MADQAVEVGCECPRLHDEEAECQCGVECAVCWPLIARWPK